jgi:transcriptional regulator with XRE-family HTH domain
VLKTNVKWFCKKNWYFYRMGFKENLKQRLNYTGMLVKELAALSGVNKYAIDNYLSTHDCMPSAENAVRIARVLGVSVEYLVTGEEPHRDKPCAPLNEEIRTLIHIAESLTDRERQIMVTLVHAYADATSK